MEVRHPPRARFAAAVFVFSLLSAPLASAQSMDASQREFAESYVSAVKSHDAATIKRLWHPATLSCIGASQSFLESIVGHELEHGAKPDTAFRITGFTPYTGPPPLFTLPEDGFAYPVAPTRQMQIEAETSDGASTTIIRFLALSDGKWFIVYPCPNENGVRFIEQQRGEADRARKLVAERVSSMAEPLRAEIKTLLAQGRKVDAIYHYRDAAGVDLTTAVAVVKAVGGKN